MKPVKQSGASNKLVGEIAAARLWLAKAESELKAAKEQSRAAKHRRKEAKQAARHAKQQVKNAKADVAEANLALADAEQKLARAAKPPKMSRTSAKVRRTANAPAPNTAPTQHTALPRRRRRVLSAATAIRATPNKSKRGATAKAKIGRMVRPIMLPPDQQEQPTATASVPGSEATAAAIPNEPITTLPKEETDRKPPTEASTTPTISPL
jgi:hypothetical protein